MGFWKSAAYSATLVAASSLPFFFADESHAARKRCSEYERRVYEVAVTVRGFRQNDEFAFYGWGTGGPYNKWLQELQALQDNVEQGRELLGAHGFAPMDIYNVANQYRTVGGLDEFYQETERNIGSLKCR
jgi:hypothetical protein